MIHLAPLKVKNKNDFLSVKGYGKLLNIRENSGNFEVDDKWQPCGPLLKEQPNAGQTFSQKMCPNF